IETMSSCAPTGRDITTAPITKREPQNTAAKIVRFMGSRMDRGRPRPHVGSAISDFGQKRDRKGACQLRQTQKEHFLLTLSLAKKQDFHRPRTPPSARVRSTNASSEMERGHSCPHRKRERESRNG